MTRGKIRKALITGGAGFIGSNLTQRLLAQPDTHVRVFDNLSRRGAVHNLEWLRSLPGHDRLEFVHGDVRDAGAVEQAALDVTEIYHLAAQVAVTTSIESPRDDFSVNVLGTFNVLEAARRSNRRPFLLFTSTNKVYGSLDRLPVAVDGNHYRAADPGFHGVEESEPLNFHSPYDCSKGAADQYVRDYARIYELPTVVFRMSCIAGPHQFGNEDQGWVAHFLYSVLEGRPITVYGDGFQVRDVLHVYDLLDAMMAVSAASDVTRGQIYNLGGGMELAISVIEMLSAIKRETHKSLDLRYSAVRPGDQPLYISDTSKLCRQAGWRPRRSLAQILGAIHRFWRENRNLFAAPNEAAAQATEFAQEVA